MLLSHILFKKLKIKKKKKKNYAKVANHPIEGGWPPQHISSSSSFLDFFFFKLGIGAFWEKKSPVKCIPTPPFFSNSCFPAKLVG
jgi:hypothetical protein